ncbi:Uncharacterized conserved protein [Nitrosomonas sp. Nm58]|nr:Uncharacterized conserved protein [Nitrosomonas sp. Nm58]
MVWKTDVKRAVRVNLLSASVVSRPIGWGAYNGLLLTVNQIIAMHDSTPEDKNHSQPKNPLHGVTLEVLLTELHAQYGWERLAKKVDINCFKQDPSIKSCLKFLRKTPWAREKVEAIYIQLKQVKS